MAYVLVRKCQMENNELILHRNTSRKMFDCKWKEKVIILIDFHEEVHFQLRHEPWKG